MFRYNNIVNILNVPLHGFTLQFAVVDAHAIPPQYLVLTMVPFPQDLVHSDHSPHTVEKHCIMYVRQYWNNTSHLLSWRVSMITIYGTDRLTYLSPENVFVVDKNNVHCHT